MLRNFIMKFHFFCVEWVIDIYKIEKITVLYLRNIKYSVWEAVINKYHSL